MTGCACVKWNSRGVVFHGWGPSGSSGTNSLDYFAPATPGNATDFGDMNHEVDTAGVSDSSGTRGVFMQVGLFHSNVNIMDYITIASAGNATDFGDLNDY